MKIFLHRNIWIGFRSRFHHKDLKSSTAPVGVENRGLGHLAMKVKNVDMFEDTLREKNRRKLEPNLLLNLLFWGSIFRKTEVREAIWSI